MSWARWKMDIPACFLSAAACTCCQPPRYAGRHPGRTGHRLRGASAPQTGPSAPRRGSLPELAFSPNLSLVRLDVHRGVGYREGEWMSLSELPVVAEGEGTQGERWFLRAGGSSEAYFSMIETVHPDGRRDEGGMGGPALYPGQLLNT